ncbi:MAG: type II toxin-antitoxin system RelB/DinJ family antitoxin [Fusobacteriaceae bacterium]|jgi:DNA-damage-inducible protein J|nr:type II toxin-antitoxin system RelB/DinJ family antitoxin [Fusobacteriaceae bacterium]
MADTNINFRTDSKLKAEAQKLFADLGLDMSTAFNLFMKQAVQRQAIPFAIEKIVNSGQKEKLPRTTAKGLFRGKITMREDFNDPMEEFEEYM